MHLRVNSYVSSRTLSLSAKAVKLREEQNEPSSREAAEAIKEKLNNNYI